MSKIRVNLFFMMLLSLAAFALLNGCSKDLYDGNVDLNDNGGGGDAPEIIGGDDAPEIIYGEINWNGDAGGTLELINGSTKDIVIFKGQTISKSSIIGGVRRGTQTAFDICKHVNDCDVGGYVILRGVSREEYEKNELDLAYPGMRVEFNSMATYKRGTKYRVQINYGYIGDYAFRAINRGRIGLELRKSSLHGEKIAYIPAFQQDLWLYTATSSAVTLFPAYVHFNSSTGEVTTLKSASMLDSITVTPRALSENLSTVYFPNDETDSWEKIVGTLKSPTAYVTVRNNVVNQSVYFTIGGSNRLVSQSDYDAIGGGEQLVFEVESVDEEDGGSRISLIAVLYGGTVMVPVLFADETDSPIIINGYNYTVEIKGSGSASSGYSAIIRKENKRDLTFQLESL